MTSTLRRHGVEVVIDQVTSRVALILIIHVVVERLGIPEILGGRFPEYRLRWHGFEAVRSRVTAAMALSRFTPLSVRRPDPVQSFV